MSETKFSLFWSDGWQPNEDEFAGLPLSEFIAVCAKEYGPPIAWASGEWPDFRRYEEARAEAIDAGRLIDCIGGKYIPRIPSKLSSLTEPNCAEQEELWAAKCQPAHVSHVEPEREALPHFNQRTPFDSFGPSFVVAKSYVGTGINASHSHALQRFNDGTDALHGSAFLRG